VNNAMIAQLESFKTLLGGTIASIAILGNTSIVSVVTREVIASDVPSAPS
jgi:hypothetical protein